jgi:MFS transporter, PAT family, beta-lactamase induction signal transducer AmpG
MAVKFTWNGEGALSVYLRRRFLVLLGLGFASGLPFVLTGGTLFLWMHQVGVDIRTIGLFAALGTPYALKFLWAPLVDHLRIPFLTARFGRRRGWILFSQALLIPAIAGLGLTSPAEHPGTAALMAFLVSLFSATQDIVIDAFRVETLEKREQAAGAAVLVYGYRIGMLASGAGALYIAASQSWSVTYTIMAALILIGSLAALMGREPARSEAAAREARPRELSAWVQRAVVDPFADFMTRKGWVAILFFIMLYKFGDALVSIQTNPFLDSLKFSNIEIANIAKVFGFGATLFGLGAGGVVMAKLGLFRSLLLCGVLQLLANLMFAGLALRGHDLNFYAATIAAENVAGGMGTAVFVAYLSVLCNARFTATQYALFSSFFAFSRSWLSSASGFMVAGLGWFSFFVATAVAAVPALFILLWLKRIDAREGGKRVFS